MKRYLIKCAAIVFMLGVMIAGSASVVHGFEPFNNRPPITKPPVCDYDEY